DLPGELHLPAVGPRAHGRGARRDGLHPGRGPRRHRDQPPAGGAARLRRLPVLRLRRAADHLHAGPPARPVAPPLQGGVGMTLLSVENLRLSFGGLLAIDDLSFSVGEAEIVSVIGPNGAGKTSAFNCVTGFYKPTAGRILFRGRDITGLRPSKIAGLGVAR